MKETLFSQYNLKIDKELTICGYKAVLSRNILYCIVPISNWEQEEIYEIKMMSDFAIQKGDIRVASILPTTSGRLSCSLEGNDVVVVRCPVYDKRVNDSLGRELAKFHKRGRSFPYPVQRSNRIGQWKYLWEKRLDQMELFWKEKVRQHPDNYFEKLFVEAFPYYIGLTENAIQYLVDTELDDFPTAIDSATICHHRFTEMSWDKKHFIRFPTDWVYDHYTRDLAEYIRDQHADGEVKMNARILEFVQDYERVSPLSSFSWRLLYARLLFPLHFFECIEGYYLAETGGKRNKQEQQLVSILENSSENERFLSTFFQKLGTNKRNRNIPEITWLAK